MFEGIIQTLKRSTNTAELSLFSISALALCAQAFAVIHVNACAYDYSTCARCPVRLCTLWGDYKQMFQNKHEYFQSEYGGL